MAEVSSSHRERGPSRHLKTTGQFPGDVEVDFSELGIKEGPQGGDRMIKAVDMGSRPKNYIKDDKEKDADDEKALDNIQTDDQIMNEKTPEAIKAEESQDEQQQDNSHFRRCDRFGVPIISRRKANQRGVKTNHKLTYIDQIQTQIS